MPHLRRRRQALVARHRLLLPHPHPCESLLDCCRQADEADGLKGFELIVDRSGRRLVGLRLLIGLARGRGVLLGDEA